MRRKAAKESRRLDRKHHRTHSRIVNTFFSSHLEHTHQSHMEHMERRENFLLRGQLCLLTFISVSVPPPCITAVARKRSRSFCQKCSWQVTAKKNVFRLDSESLFTKFYNKESVSKAVSIQTYANNNTDIHQLA